MDASRTARRRTLVSAAFAVALLALAAPVTYAQADVGITGTVRNATTAEPAADTPVRITYFDQDGQVGQAKATTDGDGVFTAIPPAAAAGYQVAVEFGGTEFRSVATQLLPDQPSVITVDVWDVTDDPTEVSVVEWTVWIDQDAQAGGWATQQSFAWANTGDLAYAPSDGQTVRVPLAEGAENVQFLGTFLEQQGEVVDGVYVSSAPIVPGESTATIRYVAPTVPTLTLPVTFEVRAFSLFVPVGLQAQAPGLRLAGTQSDQGVTYQVYTADGLAPGDELEVSFTEAAAASGGSDATTWLLVGVAIVALFAAGFFFVRGRRRSTPPGPGPRKARPAQPQNAQKTKPVAARPANGHRSERPSAVAAETEDDDEVQLLIDEIAALDLSFEKGLMDERTYRRLRVAAKDRLLLAQEAATGSRSAR